MHSSRSFIFFQCQSFSVCPREPTANPTFQLKILFKFVLVERRFYIFDLDKKLIGSKLATTIFLSMEELLKMIQQDPELWEIVDNTKHPDQEPKNFRVGAMLAVEFEEL